MPCMRLFHKKFHETPPRRVGEARRRCRQIESHLQIHVQCMNSKYFFEIEKNRLLYTKSMVLYYVYTDT
jgi:hypothetical protein